jgi:hypothetical protein
MICGPNAAWPWLSCGAKLAYDLLADCALFLLAQQRAAAVPLGSPRGDGLLRKQPWRRHLAREGQPTASSPRNAGAPPLSTGTLMVRNRGRLARECMSTASGWGLCAP